MSGTFRPGDYLVIAPMSPERVKAGDVILFDGMDADGNPDVIVHRVVAVLPDGLATRGDNNAWTDEVLVTGDNLLGLVTHVERGGERRRVRGGRSGLFRVRVLRALRLAGQWNRHMITAIGRRPYRWLRRSGLVPWLWRPSITRVYLAVDDEPVVKYVCDGRTVARWWPETGRFHCRRPYDLIISRPD
jgi:hypothetical protein